MAITLKLGSDKYNLFTKGTITLKYASAGSKFMLSGIFDPSNALHRRLFKPLSYPNVKLIVTETDELILTGTVLIGIEETFTAGSGCEQPLDAKTTAARKKKRK